METLKTYNARFTGRKVGAIGVSDEWFTTTSGLTEEDARLRLYDRFEHIQGLKLNLISVEEAGKYPTYEESQHKTKNYESNRY